MQRYGIERPLLRSLGKILDRDLVFPYGLVIVVLQAVHLAPNSVQTIAVLVAPFCSLQQLGRLLETAYIDQRLRCAKLQSGVFRKPVGGPRVGVSRFLLFSSQAVGVCQLGKRVLVSLDCFLQSGNRLVKLSRIPIKRPNRAQHVRIIRSTGLGLVQILFGSFWLIQLLVRARDQQIGTRATLNGIGAFQKIEGSAWIGAQGQFARKLQISCALWIGRQHFLQEVLSFGSAAHLGIGLRFSREALDRRRLSLQPALIAL